ncbi:hypothetical protein GTB64_004434 [Salmonella enterica]|nr:hypothetical protein [Salmonella enterica]
MDSYCKMGGDAALFENAPPLAQVVLEDISKATRRIIYAEAYKTGANWWHADGRRGRRGLKASQISDFIVKATRSPRAQALDTLMTEQMRWDIQHYRGEPVMYSNMRPCVNCGEPVADGMVHQCKANLMIDPGFPVSVCPLCGVTGAHYCTGRKPSSFFENAINWNDLHRDDRPAKPANDPDAFVSVFEPQYTDNWFRLNTAGRIKFSEALMMRFTGLKIDVAVDHKTGRVRVGEADHGKVLNGRGYCFARRLTPLVEFNGQPSVLVRLFENDDGYLYGDMKMAEPDKD